jgi:hypothetical protein
MRPCVTSRTPQLRLFVIVALVSQLVHQRPVSAQANPRPRCAVPVLNDDPCANLADDEDVSIDDYKNCYRSLYDESVIPAFRAMAQCTHDKAEHGIVTVLRGAESLTLAEAKDTFCEISKIVAPHLTDELCGQQLSGETRRESGLLTCLGNMNAAEEDLRPYIDAERTATDLDEYRANAYTPAHLTYFTNAILAARQIRADCDGLLRSLRKRLVLLSELKLSHPDYCQILRDSANYEQVSRIDALAEWTRVDPAIDFDQYYHIELVVGAQCGYYEFGDNGQFSIEHTTCDQLTVQYEQNLAEFDGVLGWIADNNYLISTVTGPAATAILSYAWLGLTAGPATGLAAVIAVVTALLISGVQYLLLQRALDSLEELIDDKEEELRNAVATNLITEEEFNSLVEQRCPPWRDIVEERFETMLARIDAPTHISNIDGFFRLSDSLYSWYNELILWATTPQQNGDRFITELAHQELLAQKHEFDQRIFGARADQEVAAVRNELSAIKGAVTLLNCSNLSTTERRNRRRQLGVAVNRFNATCSSVMAAMAAQPDAPVAFAEPGVEATVTCSYQGFRNGIATLVISEGTGFTSTMTVKGAGGETVAQLIDVSSATDFSRAGLPGFSCSSTLGEEFGTAITNRLAAATYPLRLQDNLFGFDENDASGLRSTIQTLDSQFRLKQSVCMRQMGTPTDIPRTAEACGLPAVQ